MAMTRAVGVQPALALDVLRDQVLRRRSISALLGRSDTNGPGAADPGLDGKPGHSAPPSTGLISATLDGGSARQCHGAHRRSLCGRRRQTPL